MATLFEVLRPISRGIQYPFAWYWGLPPYLVWGLSFFLLAGVPFLLNAAWTGKFSLPQWHAFRLGDPICLPIMLWQMRRIGLHWHHGNPWYQAEWGLLAALAGISLGTAMTWANYRKDLADNDGDRSKVLDSPFAGWHIGVILVFVALGVYYAFRCLTTTAPSYEGFIAGTMLGGFLLSITIDGYDKAYKGKRGGYAKPRPTPVVPEPDASDDESDPDATDGDPDTPTDAAA